MSERTCVSCGGAFAAKRSDARFCGQRCARRDYYQRNRERELAGMARWRQENYEYDRQRWADYSDRRWGADRAERATQRAARLASPDKTCTRCHVAKPKGEFHEDPRRADGRYSWCKACFHWYIASMRTPEIERARRQREWADPVRRARLRAKCRAWARAHPEAGRKAAAVRRARVLAATVESVDYGAIIERDGMWCYLCARDIADLPDLHFDHVVPLSRGGRHAMDNIRPTHSTCNQRKHNKLLSELGWYPPTT